MQWRHFGHALCKAVKSSEWSASSAAEFKIKLSRASLAWVKTNADDAAFIPDLVGDGVDELDRRAQLQLHDVDQVVLGQEEQRGAVNVVGAKGLKEAKMSFNNLT